MQFVDDVEDGIKFRMWHCPHCMHLEFETIGYVVKCRYCKNLSVCQRQYTNLDINRDRGSCAGFKLTRVKLTVKAKVEPEKVVFT